MSNKVRKVSIVSLMVLMVAAMVGFSPRPAKALAAGDLVKGPNSDAVYYIDGTMKHVFPDSKTYFTWYTSFDGIKTVAVSELDMYPAGAAVAYRPGTKLVTHPNTARVYAVEPGGNLRWISSEATATALYGSNWGKMVNDVHELTFGNYAIGSDMGSSMHSKGTLLQQTSGSTIYYYDGSNIRPFASSAAFDSNNFNYDFIVKVSSLSGYTTGSSVTGFEAAISTISGTGTGPIAPPGVAGTLTVSLSPNTPAANTVLLGGAARVPMTTIRLTAGSTAVTVDSLTVLRLGIASDAAFTSLDLLKGDTMLPINDSSKSLNSTHMAVFNDDFTVAANTSMDVVVAANMASSLASYAGEYPVFGVSAMTLKSGSTLSGTLPVTGNVMLTNGTITVGTATITGGSNNPSAATKEIGTKDYIVSSIKVSNDSSAQAQDMLVKTVTFTQNGSASATDVENLKLINANTGAVLGTIATPAEKKVSFTNLNLSILKGNNVTLDLRVDIKNGSARTISYDVDKQADVVIFDQLRGFNVLPTYTGVSSSPFYNPADTTIGNGKLRIESVAISTTTIAENQTGVLLGRFKFVMEGEAGNVTAIGFKLATTAGGTGKITNVTLKTAAGSSVAGPVDPVASGAATGQETATSTDAITVPVGETIYSLYADLDSGFAADQTIQAQIAAEAMTIKGDVSGNTITASPAGLVSSTTMTVKAAALAVSLGSAPAAQTVVAGSQDFEFGNLVFNASNSGADIRVTQVKVDVRAASSAAPNDISGIELYDGTTKIPVSSSSQACTGATCSTVNTNATTTLTIDAGNLTIPKGQTKTIKVKGDIGTGHTSGTLTMNLQGGNVSAIDSQAQTVTATYTTGAAASMTLASGGTLNIAIAQDPRAALVVAGSTVNVGQFVAQAANEAILMNSFALNIGNPDGGINAANDYEQIETLELWQSGGSSALGTISVSAANSTITPTTAITLGINEERTYIVKAKFRSVNQPSVAESGTGMTVTMTHIDADGTAAGSSSTTLSGTGTAFKTFTSFKSVPTVALSTITADQIVGSTSEVDLFKMTVTADATYPIALAKLTFGITTSTSVRLNPAGFTLWESDSSSSSGNKITDTGDAIVTYVGADLSLLPTVEARFDIGNDNQAVNAVDKGEHLIINAGVTKYLTFRGTLAAISGTANDDTITTVLAGDSAFAGTSQLSFAGIDGTDTGTDDFIWSDLNFTQYSTYTATQTAGWFNGYRVSGMSDTTSSAQTQTD